MKRSEMIQEIQNKLYEPVTADQILDLVEELGMFPPINPTGVHRYSPLPMLMSWELEDSNPTKQDLESE